MRHFITACAIILCLAGSGAATTIVLPVDGLNGTYDSDDGTAAIPYVKNISFDLGCTFLRIDQVRIRFTATVTPATWASYSLVGGGTTIEWTYEPYLQLYIHPAGTYLIVSDACVVGNGEMDVDVPFSANGSSLDILLDGKADLEFSVSSPMIMGTEVAWQVTPSYVEISDMRLIVDGEVAPEPATLSLFAAGLAVAWWRRVATVSKGAGA